METKPVNQQTSSYIISSQEDELKRIAMELHEGVGQTLYSIFTGLNFIETALDKHELKSYVHDLARQMEQTIKEVRMLSVELHPPALSATGLLPAIKSYAKQYTSMYGIKVKVDAVGEEKEIPEKSKIALFRVCQEALANIARYADTTDAIIVLSWKDDTVKLTIMDSGKGFDVAEALNKASGLAAMEGRIALAGGTCQIESALGKGTYIEVSLPFK